MNEDNSNFSDDNRHKIETDIEELRKIVAENQRILKKISRSLLVSRITKILYWLVILVLGFAVFYVMKPYLESVLSVYGDLNSLGIGSDNGGQSATPSDSTDGLPNNDLETAASLLEDLDVESLLNSLSQ